MTDLETIKRLAGELDEKNDQLKKMFNSLGECRRKIKRQRIENGRLNKTLSVLAEENKTLQDELDWIKGR